MVLAACPLPPATMTLLAAVTAGRRAPRDPFRCRHRLRAAQRLAAGMSPREVARAQGQDEAAVQELLRQEGFVGLVESCKALAELPAAEQTARLVRLARAAIETALVADTDVGAALFVLREDARGRDPAETIARAVVAASRRAARQAAAAPPAPPSPATSASPAARPPRDPGLRLLERGTARLRRALVEEHAARHVGAATVAAEAAPAAPVGAAATAEAACKTLALKAASSAPLARVARRLAGGAGITGLRPGLGGAAGPPATVINPKDRWRPP